MIFVRTLGALVFAGATAIGVAADPLQDRLDAIPQEMTALTEDMLAGVITEEEALARIEALMVQDMQLRTGDLDVEDLTIPRWRDRVDIPHVTAGVDLVATNLPEGFEGPVWAILSDGQRLKVEARREADTSRFELILTMPIHPDGLQHGDTVRFRFGGAEPMGDLQAELVPVVNIANAIPQLMQAMLTAVVQDLTDRDVDPVLLVQQVRNRPTAIAPENNPAAMLLLMWSEARRGNPTFEFLATGAFNGPLWQDFDGSADAQALNLVASAALMNALTPQMMIDAPPEVLQKISAPAPPTLPRVYRARLGSGKMIEVPLKELAPMVRTGREMKAWRENTIASAKSAHKIADSFTVLAPQAATASLVVGTALTLADQALKAGAYEWPHSVRLRAKPAPDSAMRADDSRPMAPLAEFIAEGDGYEIMGVSDALDATLLAWDIIKTFGGNTRAGAFLNRVDLASHMKGAGITGFSDDAVDLFVAHGKFAAKEGLEGSERLAQHLGSGSTSLIKVPGQVWRADVTKDNYEPHVDINYLGEVKMPGKRFDNLACWNGSGTGATAHLRAKSPAFGPVFEKARLDWAVQTPKLSMTPDIPVLQPGQSTGIAFSTSGAEAKEIKVFPPALGAVSGVAQGVATYKAPDDIASCAEIVSIEAEYPTGPEAENICTAPPRFSTAIAIKKGDAIIQTPGFINCSEGDVSSFTVSHPAGTALQCSLIGPGRLRMEGNRGVFECPDRDSGSSYVTCHTGTKPSMCSPVIPVRNVFPDFGTYLHVDLSLDPEEDIMGMIELLGLSNDPCDASGLTGVALSLLDGNLGLTDGWDVANLDCTPPTDTPAPKGTSMIGTGGGEAKVEFVEARPEGRHISWQPLGAGQSLTAEDRGTRKEGEGHRRWRTKTREMSAQLDLVDSHNFTVRTNGTLTEKVGDPDMSIDGGARIHWAVARRVTVAADAEISVHVELQGSAQSIVTVVPARLQGRVPVTMLRGFNGSGLSPLSTAIGEGGATSNFGTAFLPGPRRGQAQVTYLMLFTGTIAPELRGEDSTARNARANVSVDVNFEIRDAG